MQEALLRLHRVLERGEELASVPAYVATITTRLALDHLRSARRRREEYVGEWLPEPLVDEPDAHWHAEMADSMSLAVLILLESLSPEQRAVFVLRDVFGYGYDEIADIVGKSESNVRQMAVRARRYVAERRKRFEARREDHQQLTIRFIQALRGADLATLEAHLAQDVVLHGDGGGKAPAIRRPLVGSTAVAKAILAWARGGLAIGATARAVSVNGGPGVLVLDGLGRVLTVMGIEFVNGRVAEIHSIVNPDKLRHIGPPGDIRNMVGARR